MKRPPARPVALSALLALVAAGCGTVTTDSSSAGPGAGYPVTVSSCGVESTLDARPERVVSLHPSTTDTLARLGVADTIVARAQTAAGEVAPDVAEEVASIPTISEDSPPTRELLLEQEPDLVLAPTEFEFSADQGYAGREDLEAVGAGTHVAAAGCVDRRSEGTIEDAFDDLDALATLFDVEEAAAEVEQEARAELAEVEQIVGDAEPVPTAQVYVEGGTLYAIGGAIEIDILRQAGARNVFEDDPSRFADFFSAEVSPEVVLEQQPEALVFTVTDEKHARETEAFLRDRLADTPAVREDRLVAIDNGLVYPGTLRAIEAARTVAEALHE